MPIKLVDSGSRIPIKLWLDDIEEGAMAQATNLANLPFAYKHIAIMPDSHQGYGMPIGGVLATEGVVIPNAVGVDIGCGMIAKKLELTHIDTAGLKDIVGLIREQIPLGFNKHKQPVDIRYMPERLGGKIAEEEDDNALLSLGTLGGGNHFIEIQKGKDGHIWIMIHSGSRNLGYKTAEYYNKVAIGLNKKWHTIVPEKWQLAFLPIESEEGQEYLCEMAYCVEFAKASRRHMLATILEIMNGLNYEVVGWTRGITEIAHNYATMENHFGKNVMVHRKGATLASVGTTGIIPGSQGSNSYIVSGRGNADSFNSCSHGAGRKMSRTQAKRDLNLEDEQHLLDIQGILHSVRGEKNLDESPGAYKNIEKVMKNQTDLVDIVDTLRPLAVVKG